MTRPTVVDPYRAQEMMGITIVKSLYDGLLHLDDDQTVRPNVAESWGCNADGDVWTFRLGVRSRFSTGELVTAHHFAHAWNRACDPVGHSETTYHLAAVKGYRDRRHGDAADLAGVRVPDAQTLVVELEQPDFEFHLKTLQPVFLPVPLTAPAPVPDDPWSQQPVGNGPLMLDGPWRGLEAESIVLIPNPQYRGPRPPAGDRIEIEILEPASAYLAEQTGLETGRFDLVSVAPRSPRPGVKHVARRLNATIYLIPFCQGGSMADRALRKAVDLALDRRLLAQLAGVLPEDVTRSLVPPSLRSGTARGIEPDPDAAKRALSEAGQVDEHVDLVFNVEGGHEAWTAEVGRQLADVLGLHVRLRSMTAAEVVAHRTAEPARGLCRAGWVADYPTSDNFLFPLLHSSCISADLTGRAHGDNEGRYVSAEFDELVMRARATADAVERAALRELAEERAIGADQALIPLWHVTAERWYAAESLAGVSIDPFGCLALEQLHRPLSRPRRVMLVGGRDLTVRHARSAGIEVVNVQHPSLLTSPRLDPGVVEVGADYGHPAVGVVIEALTAGRPVAGVLSLTEPGSVPAARAREKLGVPGHPAEVSVRLRDKVAMREHLATRGVEPLVPHLRITSRADLQRFAETAGYPFIVKPSTGTASIGVHLVDAPDELDRVWDLLGKPRDDIPFAQLFDFTETIAESFVAGAEVSVEAFSCDGAHTVLGVTEKVTTDGFVEVGHIFPARLSDSLRSDVGAAAERALTALGITDGPSHLEFMLTSDGPTLIEAHDRIGGDRIFDLVRLATGFDMEQASVLWAARAVPALACAPPARRAAATRFATGAGVLTKVHTASRIAERPGYIDHTVNVAVGQSVGGNANWDRLGQVVCVGPTPQIAAHRAEEILTHLSFEFQGKS